MVGTDRMQPNSYIDTTMNYLKPDGTKPVLSAMGESHIAFETFDVRIEDARSRMDRMSLDVEGISVVDIDSKIKNFYDDDEVRTGFYDEITDVVEQCTGTRDIFILGHQQRSFAGSNAGGAPIGAPAFFVHTDWTESSGFQLARDFHPAFRDEDHSADRRFVLLTLWKPIVGPVRHHPIAICDAQTVEQQELVATDLNLRDFSIEIYTVTHSDSHSWYYISDMAPTEIAVFKGYDSERDGPCCFTPHTAFQVPDLPPNTPGRESIEVRAVAVY